MYIYNSKLNWFQYAVNEDITIVFPAGFALNDPVSAYWQWSVDASGVEKANSAHSTLSLRLPINIKLTSHSATTASKSSSRTLTATMLNTKRDRSDPITLTQRYADPARVPSTVVYTGKLEWSKYAKNEMVTLIIPAGVSNGAPVTIMHQWTVDSGGNKKANHDIRGTFRDVTTSPSGDVKGTLEYPGYYTYEVTVLNGGQEATVRMSNPGGSTTTNSLKQTDFRGLGTKKALIVRFSTGTDRDTFLVQDMLTKHLGFAQSDVEVYCLDLSSQKGHQQGTNDQDPPAVAAFKAKFIALLTRASAGDVRFVYVDDVTGKVVNGVWVGNAIRQNFKPGVNLTMMTSSCLFNGLLDPSAPTPGILLAACHETQFNVKAQKTNDGLVGPWEYAITAIIEKQVQRKGGVPSYDVLFNEAKRSVKKLFDGGLLDPKYKGPSPDETAPTPRNQDPELIFYNGYMDPGVERFLFPFEAVNGGQAIGDLTRYPRNELDVRS
ncbi:hypothetical protein WG66_004144 [Moniliophthora roreri]|nr:hypothetical protein WG66_004144 [Moniliophthora roreri]